MTVEGTMALKDVKDRILEFLAVRQLLGRAPGLVGQGMKDQVQPVGC